METEKCGSGIGKSWECLYGNGVSATDLAAEIPEVEAEVGPYCRCGCVVHLGQAKPKRLLATSSQSCPGRTFWLIQVSNKFPNKFIPVGVYEYFPVGFKLHRTIQSGTIPFTMWHAMVKS